MTELRKARATDEDALRRLWETVFGPETAFIEAFFKTLFTAENTAAAEVDGEIVSAAYGIDFGGRRYIYAVGTHPAYRGLGLGKAVTMLAADGKPAYLTPAEESLRDWYVREMGARPVWYRPVYARAWALFPVSPEEYAARREALLSDVAHTVYPRAVLELFSQYGAFWADSTGAIRATADGRVCEALPCTFSSEPYVYGLNGAEPIYWGLTLE